jgi:hypothetical protein
VQKLEEDNPCEAVVEEEPGDLERVAVVQFRSVERYAIDR